MMLVALAAAVTLTRPAQVAGRNFQRKDKG